MEPRVILALDFGGTKHTAGVLEVRALWNYSPSAQPGEEITPGVTGELWTAVRREFAPPGSSAQTDLRLMFDMASDLLAGSRPAAIGVSFGGPVDSQQGVVRLSHHVPGWENIPLASLLWEEFGAPARVDNDANAAALGEYRFGAGRGYSSLLYITVSTGVGSGWILDGEPWRGHGGMAGEIGHTVVDPSGLLCLCGKHGCVERFASGPYMAADARELLARHPEQGALLRALAGGDLEKIDARMLSQAAEQGDELAWSVLERGARALGTGIGNAANLVNPQRFILGGGVTKSGPRWWETVRAAARSTALPEVEVDIVPARLGDHAPLWGAVALAQDLVTQGSQTERRI